MNNTRKGSNRNNAQGDIDVILHNDSVFRVIEKFKYANNALSKLCL
jgi:hypothetical protein